MKRNQLIIAAVVIAVLLVGGIFFLSSRSGNKSDTGNESDIDVIPTVDASVKVKLEKTGTYDAQLSVSGIPDGTKELYYELSYETKDQGTQGTFNTEPIKIKPGQKTYQTGKDTIAFKTCSAGGACVNYQVTSKVSTQVKFVGNYGERLFIGEFEL